MEITAQLDQNDYPTLYGQLLLHAANLRAIASNHGHAFAAPDLKGKDVYEKVDALVTHITEIEGKLGTLAPVFQSKFMAARHEAGIPHGQANPGYNAASPKLSQPGKLASGAANSVKYDPDAELLKARGVKSYADLNALPPATDALD